MNELLGSEWGTICHSIDLRHSSLCLDHANLVDWFQLVGSRLLGELFKFLHLDLLILLVGDLVQDLSILLFIFIQHFVFYLIFNFCQMIFDVLLDGTLPPGLLDFHSIFDVSDLLHVQSLLVLLGFFHLSVAFLKGSALDFDFFCCR